MSTTNYKVTLTAIGPVHVGTGNQYGKKDYYLRNGKITVLDAAEFVSKLDAQQLEAYCEFLKTSSSDGLQDFLDRHNLSGIADQAEAYHFDLGLSRARRGTYQYFDVYEFAKDAYGCPYVPGSTFKGMLRTAILTDIISNDRNPFEQLYDRREVQGKSRQSQPSKNIEKEAFCREIPDPSNPKEANDIMRYLSVSDSEPLSVSDLVLVKKYDKFSKKDAGTHKSQMGGLSDPEYYEGNELNIYRESLKPGTKIEFTLNIDERINKHLKLDPASLRAILQKSFDLYNECFLSRFDTDDDLDTNLDGSSSGGSSRAGLGNDGKCRYVAQTGPAAGSQCPNKAVNGTGYCGIHKCKASQPVEGSDEAEATQELICYLGGGVGFGSKTVINALFEDDETRLEETAHILYSQFPTKIDESLPKNKILGGFVRNAGFEPERIYGNGKLKNAKNDPRHWRYKELEVSPPTLKLGEIGSKLYPMGKCRIEIKELK
ncbi:MAG: type III-A CRISPR-associated RAMP protein Csm5 [Coriobacteriales bacterium]|jgi:CRISPR/Cas system CSM-associated protein Csm5 (group 7 of RAMP superfamily)|nr:type III-A CRISPR-associated RAMP protein Csm5 [Coriobacteriales bacterium]